MKNFGINGFGRIGRTAFRTWWQYYRNDLDLKVINTSGSMSIAGWVQLLKYDSNYKTFGPHLEFEEFRSNKKVTDETPEIGKIKIEGKEIIVMAQKDPAKIPWGKYGVEVVLESTGVFVDEAGARLHLTGGAKQVVISAPAKEGNVSTAVIGVNNFDPNNPIRSNASCTTNCITPVVKVILDSFGIKKAMMTTIHSFTDDQNLHDNSHKKDLRRARAAGQNIVPTTTGAAKATTEIIPALKGLFDGLAIRVPTPVGSLSDMVFVTDKKTTVEEVNKALTDAANGSMKGILAVTSDPIVSSDIIGRQESSIVDLELTQVIDGDLVKVVSWYDNEWGYCCRLLETAFKV